MSNQHQGKAMPRSLDDPDQMLLWSVDELVPVAVCFGLGITMHQMTAAVVGIFVFLKVYRRFRNGRPNGYMQHIMYWYGFAGNETVTIRNPFIRRFLP
jgi:conjugal transfer pilus assembly protein TraL